LADSVKTGTRLLSAAILLPIFFYGVFSQRFYIQPLFIFIITVTFLGIYEFIAMQENRLVQDHEPKSGAIRKGRPFLWIALVAGFSINIFFYFLYLRMVHPEILPSFLQQFKMDFFLLILILMITVITSLFSQLFFRPVSGASNSISLTLLPVLYIALPLSLVFLLKQNLDSGAQSILMAASSAFMADAGAFFIGVYFGRHKANFAASPNKSWEGYAGGLFFNVLGLILIAFLFDYFAGHSAYSYAECILLGLILGIAGQLGDLSESAFKRDCGLKDSGTIIPGHGGVLDLIDAVLVNVPLLFSYIYFFKN
jgi:phosphatidate cytidylyltransferase